MKKIRTPRVHNFHIGIFKRLAKTYSGSRVMACIWGLTFVGVIKFFTQFKRKQEESQKEAEVYNRLLSVFQKNKFGFHTRIFADFDLFLEAVLNERFIDEACAYYDDPIVSKEVEDLESGLNSDFAQADVKHMLKDKDDGHHTLSKCARYPARHGTNYDKSDDLSVYKVLPKGQKPIV